MRFSQRRSRSALKTAFDHVPLNEADELVLGTKSKNFQDVLANNLPGAKYWEDRDHSKKVKDIAIPVHLVGGWYDIFLPYQLNDYASIRASGKTTPFLTIGPWTHESLGALFAGLRESIVWFDAHLRDIRSKLRDDPVSIYLMGKNLWVNLLEWPPPGMKISNWYLSGGKLLDQEVPQDDSPPDSFSYDPKDPTPSIGGIVLGTNAVGQETIESWSAVRT
jgi:putative CocE/NonD family hydrolase